MKTRITVTATLLLAPLLSMAIETPSTEVTTEILVKSTTSWDGESFEYPKGQGELTVSRITIPRGVTLPLHCHPVPLAGVISSGTLEVRKESGESVVIIEGSGLIEVFNQWHHGHAIEKTEIIVVYAGAAGLPVTVLRDSDPALTAQCK